MFFKTRLLRTLLLVSCTMVALIDHLPGRAESVSDKCGLEDGLLRIAVTGSDKSYFYEWSASGLKLTGKRKGEFSTVDASPAGSVYAGRWDEHVTGLTQDFLGTDLRLDAPFAVSRNGQLLISAVYPAHSDLMLSPSRKLALIDLRTKRLILSFRAWCEVGSLAWSPKGKYFAVLLSQDVTKKVWKSPLDWFAMLVGHPISYHTLYVATYDLDGRVLCEKRLVDNLSIGRGYIVWEQAEGTEGDSG